MWAVSLGLIDRFPQPHVVRMANAVMPDGSLDPSDIRLLRAIRIMLETQHLATLIEELHGDLSKSAKARIHNNSSARIRNRLLMRPEPRGRSPYCT